MHFGVLEVTAIMHQLLLRNRWTVPPGYAPPIDYGTGPQPGDGLPIELGTALGVFDGLYEPGHLEKLRSEERG